MRASLGRFWLPLLFLVGAIAMSVLGMLSLRDPIIVPSIGLAPQVSEPPILSARLIGQQDGIDTHIFDAAQTRTGFAAPHDAHIVFTCPPETQSGITVDVAHGMPIQFGTTRFWGYEYSDHEVDNLHAGKSGRQLFDGKFWFSDAERAATNGAYDTLATPGLTVRPGKRYYVMVDGATLGAKELRISCFDSDHDTYNDAVEDVDGDGVVDPGESDPHNPTSTPYSGAEDELHLAIAVARGTGSNAPMNVRVHAVDDNNVPQTDIPMSVTASGATVGAVTEISPGIYQAFATAVGTDHEVVITARVGDIVAQKTVLALSFVGAAWDQPEPVEGLVNVAWEDSIEVSPDGEWLIVGTASPVSLFCCSNFGPSINSIAGDNVCAVNASAAFHPNVSDPVCSTSLGPVTAPARPGFFGAERVLSPTSISHEIPSLGLTQQVIPGVPIPPVATFGFHRLSDGTYGEPFVIGYDMDGYSVAPFGFSFAGESNGRHDLVYAFNDLADGLENGTDIFRVSARLGSPVVLGSYGLSGGVIRLSGQQGTPLLVAPGSQGNPHLSSQFLWTDDEAGTKELYVAPRTATGVGTLQLAGVSNPGVDESQPYFDGNRLYFTRDTGMGLGIMSSLWSGSAITSSASWSAPQAEISPGSLQSGLQKPDGIFAVGEPTIARFDGHTWLYFVYIERQGGTINANAARVRSR